MKEMERRIRMNRRKRKKNNDSISKRKRKRTRRGREELLDTCKPRRPSEVERLRFGWRPPVGLRNLRPK